MEHVITIVYGLYLITQFKMSPPLYIIKVLNMFLNDGQLKYFSFVPILDFRAYLGMTSTDSLGIL